MDEVGQIVRLHNALLWFTGAQWRGVVPLSRGSCKAFVAHEAHTSINNTKTILLLCGLERRGEERRGDGKGREGKGRGEERRGEERRGEERRGEERRGEERRGEERRGEERREEKRREEKRREEKRREEKRREEKRREEKRRGQSQDNESSIFVMGSQQVYYLLSWKDRTTARDEAQAG
ncbi:hypothetical protein GRJ2_001601600 [Grus japonensis]|uniref:Uncharacterized protein n=1 Tax=Grus japonensis TaxID=30415 RepID=A0ABC9X0Y8_GRUJA